MLKWRTINYKMKAPPARREPREIVLESRREATGMREEGGREEKRGRYVHT